MQFLSKNYFIPPPPKGLGREYALLLASRGAAVLVNDLGGPSDGGGVTSGAGRGATADAVVREIKARCVDRVTPLRTKGG